MNYEKIGIVVFITLLSTVLLIGCNSNEDVKSIEQIDESKLYFVKDWEDDLFVQEENSFNACVTSLLKYYGIQEFTVHEQDQVGLPQFGESYMNLIDRIQQQYGIVFAYVDTDYEGIVSEIKNNRPVISSRMVRNVVEDFVFIIGYDEVQNMLIGRTVINKEHIFISKDDWGKNYQLSGYRYTIFASKDAHDIAAMELSDIHWIQKGVTAIKQKDYVQLEEVLEVIRMRSISDSQARNMNTYYYLIVKKEITDEVLQHIHALNEVASDASLTSEYNLHYYLLIGDEKKLEETIAMIMSKEWYWQMTSETLVYLKQRFIELANYEIVERIDVELEGRGETL